MFSWVVYHFHFFLLKGIRYHLSCHTLPLTFVFRPFALLLSINCIFQNSFQSLHINELDILIIISKECSSRWAFRMYSIYPWKVPLTGYSTCQRDRETLAPRFHIIAQINGAFSAVSVETSSILPSRWNWSPQRLRLVFAGLSTQSPVIMADQLSVW